jgi:hypothetical protein
MLPAVYTSFLTPQLAKNWCLEASIYDFATRPRGFVHDRQGSNQLTYALESIVSVKIEHP